MTATRSSAGRLVQVVFAVAMAAICTAAIAKPKEKAPAKDAYAEYVWPAPPDEARIRLVDILSMRADVEASSRFTRALIGASPDDLYSRLLRPIGCAFDAKGRLLVTDAQLTAVLRFDRKGRRMDVLGTTGALKLKLPMGINVGADGRIYVADAGAQRVVAFDEEGKSLAAYGRKGELVNPTDSALSPDGTRLYVTDSKANKIVVFDVATSKVLTTLGEEGAGEGQFNRPSAIAVDRDGSIFVVDAINARIQILSPDGEFLQTLGALGTAPGQFVRPKDVAIDAEGRVYVSDGAFNNVQVFDKDLQLLTFVGDAGGEPGRFQIPGGIGIGGKHFAVVDQLGARIEVFEHIPEAPKAESSGQ